MLPKLFSPLRLLVGFFIALTLAFTFTPPPAHAQSDDDLLVVASIQPLEGLVAAVLGDHGRTTSIVRGTFSPHDMTLQPSHLRLLGEADLVVMIDPLFEVFMASALASLGAGKDVIAMAEVEGMTLHPYATASHDDHDDDGHDDHKHGDHADHHDGHGHEDKHDDHADHHEGHKHDDDHKHGHDDKHEEAHADHHDHHGHDDKHDDHHGHGHAHEGDTDLHIWLSPDNARLMLDAIATRLAMHAPQHRHDFQANAEAAKASITEVETALASRLTRATRGNTYLFFHDAFGYFTKHFGMDGTSAIAHDPHLPLTRSRIEIVEAALADQSLVCVFAEPQYAMPAIPGLRDFPRATLDPLGSSIAVTTGTDSQALHYTRLLTSLADSIIGCRN